MPSWGKEIPIPSVGWVLDFYEKPQILNFYWFLEKKNITNLIQVLVLVPVPVPVLLGWLESTCVSFKIWRIWIFFVFVPWKNLCIDWNPIWQNFAKNIFSIFFQYLKKRKSHSSQGLHLNPSSNFKPTTVKIRNVPNEVPMTNKLINSH